MPKATIATIIFIVFLSINNCWVSAQVGQWTWIKGSDTANPRGVYGLNTIGDTANHPGGRRGGVSWTDTAGNLWIFGGNGYGAMGGYGYINDLWRFTKSNNTWTWMKGGKSINEPSKYGTRGIASPYNMPGARTGSVGWADTQGNLWLFGGITFDYRYVSDVWKYSIANNEWTWVKGDTITMRGTYGTKGIAAIGNTPAGRCFANCWYDPSGKLYLFGGQSSDVSISWYNDLWVYNIGTNQWTWMNGDSTANNLGIYGAQNIPSPTNKPGSRNGAFSWRDLKGNCWMMGGLGYSSTTYDYLNDLWKYDPLTNNWTWVNGSATGNQGGQYGTLGMPWPINVPGSRLSANTWTDKEGNLWLLGGRGLAEASVFGDMNDLWKFDIATNNWIWMGGDKTTFASGIYGTKGQPSINNKPGAREQSFTWKDSNGDLLLMGGGGYGALGGNEYFLNDLWRYKPLYALPVHLISFNAGISGKQVDLEWLVDNEQNFSHYELQRSANGEAFVTIAKQKPGIDNNKNKYTYTDVSATLFPGPSNRMYYRLKMIDLDGKYTFSRIAHVVLSGRPGMFSMYPNPANEIVHLQFNQQNAKPAAVVVINKEGKVIMHREKVNPNDKFAINSTHWTSGNYTIRVSIGNEISSGQLTIVR